ncbi:MAG: TIGR04282 family arsenosugar biosynthesis glycosyltransferase [Pseudomonadota bacterium]
MTGGFAVVDRRPTLVIFARLPQAGRVKTRLARDIGTVGAVWWYRHQLTRLLRSVGHDPRWHTVLAVAPPWATVSPAWRSSLPRLSQGPGDLGQRMGRVFRRFPAGKVAIIGSDIPGIRPAHIAEAFAMLGRADAVFGPSPDGGYWLVGLARGRQRAPAGLFADVRWSTHHALADTLAGLNASRIGFAAPLSDVDTGSDLLEARLAGITQ